MPTYDYVCTACGHEFEHFQSMSDRYLRTCPACKKVKLIRKVGAGAAVIFKGSGFYQTDYKTKPAEPAAAPASGEGAAGGCGKPACGTTPGTCASDGGGASKDAGSSKESGPSKGSGGSKGAGQGSKSSEGSKGSKGSKE